jgi:hypothetical protein
MHLQTDKKENKVYHQTIPLIVVIAAITSMVATYVFYANYSETDSIVQLILANIVLLTAIVFVKPIVEWRRIEIDNEFITIHKLFFKPIKINISQSLYEVVINNDEIQSYRFRVGKNFTQISPQMYKDGKELTNKIKAHIAQNKLFIDAI